MHHISKINFRWGNESNGGNMQRIREGNLSEEIYSGRIEDCYIQIKVLIRLIIIHVNATMAIPCFLNLQVIMENWPLLLGGKKKKKSEKVKNVEISTFVTTNNYCTTYTLLFKKPSKSFFQPKMNHKMWWYVYQHY